MTSSIASSSIGTGTAGGCGPWRFPTWRPSSGSWASGLPPSWSEVGWRLASEQWGHGYATEAAREALRFGFDTVGLEEIVSFTVPQNVRSRRVMERIGLVRDPAGDFDHPRVDRDAYPHLVRHVMHRRARVAWKAGFPD